MMSSLGERGGNRADSFAGMGDAGREERVMLGGWLGGQILLISFVNEPLLVSQK